jgi:hypothetical protein
LILVKVSIMNLARALLKRREVGSRPEVSEPLLVLAERPRYSPKLALLA